MEIYIYSSKYFWRINTGMHIYNSNSHYKLLRLDNNITTDELDEVVKHLKYNKSHGLDGYNICNTLENWWKTIDQLA